MTYKAMSNATFCPETCNLLASDDDAVRQITAAPAEANRGATGPEIRSAAMKPEGKCTDSPKNHASAADRSDPAPNRTLNRTPVFFTKPNGRPRASRDSTTAYAPVTSNIA